MRRTCQEFKRQKVNFCMNIDLKKHFNRIITKTIIPDTDCYLCHGRVSSVSHQSKLICHFCHDQLPLLAKGCPVCAMPIATSSSLPDSPPCGDCLKLTPNYYKTVAAFHYQPPISDFITRLKFNGQLHFVALLSEYLLQAIKKNYLSDNLPQAIIAVPLHPQKTRERGFNQARLIASSLSRQLQLPLLTKQVRRTRYTKAQSALNAAQRQRNLKGAFSIAPLQYHTIALVDDVMTTGSTANEISHQLIKAGVKRVDIWCVARAFSI